MINQIHPRQLMNHPRKNVNLILWPVHLVQVEAHHQFFKFLTHFFINNYYFVVKCSELFNFKIKLSINKLFKFL